MNIFNAVSKTFYIGYKRETARGIIMPNYKAIPQGYMTVGEVAKKMGVTVRTLQYYDKEGLLSPSAKSEGGRRLYNSRDLVILHQILSLKALGFSLDNIKEAMVSLDTPDGVADALEKQAVSIRGKIGQLSASLAAIEQLRTEVLQMQTVDFSKYADIIINLQMENEFYYLIKHFDEDTLGHIRHRFDKESGMVFMYKFQCLTDKILELQKNGVPVESEECQKLTGEYWELVMEFTGGDMSLIPNLIEIGKFVDVTNEWGEKQKTVNAYLEPALEIYFSKLGTGPFGEVHNE